MAKAFYPGSFNPPTWGHMYLIRRAAKLFDSVVVGIGENSAKKSLLTTEEIVEGLQNELKDVANVEITSFSGLAVAFAKKHKVDFFIRGLRSASDMEFEKQMAYANYKLSGIETFFMLAGEETQHISSSLIRELAMNHAPLKDFIPSYFENLLYKKQQKD